MHSHFMKYQTNEIKVRAGIIKHTAAADPLSNNKQDLFSQRLPIQIN